MAPETGTIVEAESARERSRRGVMLIIASPSGAGKSTLSRLLLQTDKDITMSVSVTTRPRRASEVDGVHYRFIPERDFLLMRERGELLEHAQVHGNYYGTPRAPVEAALELGRDILFDIDVQGTLQLYEAMRPDVASVFILPPSIAELEKRLARRAEDDHATIRRRLRTALGEIERWRDYDYVLVNDDLERTFHDLEAILKAERVRRTRRENLEPLVGTLTRDLAEVLAGEG
ncbi:guanylate kinase [Salinarimonas rosea]|uniref:guanylate kinase n=1 Tax=Salinarimonas rosea TaxID=552063 RepID=UPI0003F9ABEA|nr:guanylate kinase [Salinarimonas rosea]